MVGLIKMLKMMLDCHDTDVKLNANGEVKVLTVCPWLVVLDGIVLRSMFGSGEIWSSLVA